MILQSYSFSAGRTKLVGVPAEASPAFPLSNVTKNLHIPISAYAMARFVLVALALD